VEGRFAGDHGVFECQEVIGGHRVLMRFEWLKATRNAPRWQQSFSWDEGETWKLNWVMDLRRAS
jgi:hypothetical protein